MSACEDVVDVFHGELPGRPACPWAAAARAQARRKDIEIAVLRHQLMIVQRHVPRPRYNDNDRLLLSVLANLLRRGRWCVLLVTPATLLRWHPELVRRPAAAAGGPGRWRASKCAQRRTILTGDLVK